MNRNSLVPVLGVAALVLVFTVLWFTGSIDILLGKKPEVEQTAGLSIDLETLQITIRTVSSPEIEDLKFVEAIDTLSAKENVDKLRNPFVKVYVAPPPSPKPKTTTPRKKTSTPVRKKTQRIVRPKITINGIIWDLSNPYAILNNDIYGEGDIIQGYTVQTIQDTMIVLANKDDIYSIVIERE